MPCANTYKFDRIFANTTPFLSQQDTVADPGFVERGGGGGPLKEEPINLRSRMKPKRGPRGRRSRVLKLLQLLLGVNLAIYMYIYMIINIGHQKEGGGGL